jgi:hypothetical protein
MGGDGGKAVHGFVATEPTEPTEPTELTAPT